MLTPLQVENTLQKRNKGKNGMGGALIPHSLAQITMLVEGENQAVEKEMYGTNVLELYEHR